jgi:uncharacterized protein DUF6988
MASALCPGAGIEDFRKDRFDCKVYEMIGDLTKLESYQGGVLSASWNQQKKLFNSFTHSGYHHVRRRISADGIGANYPEQELIGAIGYVDAIAIMCVLTLGDICKNEELMRSALEKAREYSI